MTLLFPTRARSARISTRLGVRRRSRSWPAPRSGSAVVARWLLCLATATVATLLTIAPVEAAQPCKAWAFKLQILAADGILFKQRHNGEWESPRGWEPVQYIPMGDPKQVRHIRHVVLHRKCIEHDLAAETTTDGAAETALRALEGTPDAVAQLMALRARYPEGVTLGSEQQGVGARLVLKSWEGHVIGVRLKDGTTVRGVLAYFRNDTLGIDLGTRKQTVTPEQAVFCWSEGVVVPAP